MNAKMMVAVVLGTFGLGLGAQDVSASDLSRFLEHSRINLAFGSGPTHPNYCGPHGC